MPRLFLDNFVFVVPMRQIKRGNPVSALCDHLHEAARVWYQAWQPQLLPDFAGDVCGLDYLTAPLVLTDACRGWGDVDHQ